MAKPARITRRAFAWGPSGVPVLLFVFAFLDRVLQCGLVAGGLVLAVLVVLVTAVLLVVFLGFSRGVGVPVTA